MTAESPKSFSRSELRASHADREAVVTRLNEAAAEGRIDLDELEERLEQALTARTYADLAPLTADLLPVASRDPGQPLVLKGGFSSVTRVGRWQVPAKVIAYGGLGGVRLDFTRTDCRLPEVEVEAHGQMAGVTIIVPDGWAVDIGDMDPGLGGLRDKTTSDRLPGTPLIRLTGTGGAAGVVVRHPNSWERHKLKRA